MEYSRTILILCLGILLAAAGCGEGGEDPPAADAYTPVEDAAPCGPATCGGCCDAKGKCVLAQSAASCGLKGAACKACTGGKKCVGGKCAKVGSCSAVSCPSGCCQGTQCKPGNAKEACGSAGAPCSLCDAGQSCVGQTCKSVASCSPSNCATGCCKAGVCKPGNAKEACGSAGKQCVACGAGQGCVGGECKPMGGCSPSTCGGCCKAGTCKPGNTDAECGTGGVSCAACAAGQSCQSGVCSATPCSPATCSSGCCKAGKCEPGSTSQACGSAGQQCATCSVGQSCVAGVCKASGCSPSTCSSGCCKAGKCEAGNTSAACGSSGQQCAACGPGQSCVNGACKTTGCSPASCKSGCCQGTTCRTGMTSSACGSGGAACKSCLKYEYCGSQQCKLSSFSSWDLTIVSAKIDKTAKSSWDTWPDNGDPDAYVEVVLSGTTKKTSVVNNNWTPTWNEKVGSATAYTFMNTGFTMRVKESDLLLDQTIGECKLTATAGVITSGSGVIYSCTDASGKNYIKEVNFKFTAK